VATTAAPISAAEIQKKWHTDFDSPNCELFEKDEAWLTEETMNDIGGGGGFVATDSVSAAATR
jgi:hypothetical protein